MKLKKPRALTFVELLKVATGGHFQDSKFMISLKHPGLSLVSFYAPGPFVAFSEYMNSNLPILQEVVNNFLFHLVPGVNDGIFSMYVVQCTLYSPITKIRI